MNVIFVGVETAMCFSYRGLKSWTTIENDIEKHFNNMECIYFSGVIPFHGFSMYGECLFNSSNKIKIQVWFDELGIIQCCLECFAM